MRFRILALVCCISVPMLSQVKENDSINDRQDRIMEYQLDIVNRYLWRGQCWGGNYVAVQPTITYKEIKNWEFEFWASSNFKNDLDKGYQEIDFSVAYYFRKDFYIKLSDYYWPSVERISTEDDGYFNYGKDGVKSVDLSVNLDRTCDDCDGTYPFIATLSVLIAGNDFRYDANNENPKQNYTTYAELGYMFTFFQESKYEYYLTPFAGAVFNNQAGYYVNADENKVSVCNLGIEASKEFPIGEKGFKIPVSLSYIHNAATENTETYGRDFLIATLSFQY